MKFLRDDKEVKLWVYCCEYCHDYHLTSTSHIIDLRKLIKPNRKNKRIESE